MAALVVIEVWSDLVCPWCYLGKRRLERALSELEDGTGFEIRWRAFQLQPDAPRFGQPGAGMPASDRLRTRGLRPDQAEAMQARVTELAAAEGLAYRLERSHHVNTFDAHVLIQSATDRTTAAALVERLFRAQLMEGRRIDDPAVLAEIAAAVGLPELGEEARAQGAKAVEEDVAAARRLEIGAVPCFLFDRRLLVSGAQPVEVFREAIGSIASSGKERADVL